ncbi:MAG: phosphomannomutase/phosphoglucomutase [Clostridia bacterium]|nr:phosphomannomutase/phosphoglucomutase [Clostridia bacterium]
MSIFKDCDIRGIYGKELRNEDAYHIGRGLGAMLPPSATMRVGGDVRLSTPELKEQLIAGLTDSGVKVEDMGVIPTPALYYALANGSVDGGATVTASHNPPEYNGVKFMLGQEIVSRAVTERLADIIARRDYPVGSGSVVKTDILPAYLASLTKRFGARRPLHVVVDAGNGAMSHVAPTAFRSVGYRVTELFCEPDGAFPNRDPNPAEYKHLTALCEKVTEVQADFGVAFDGDGDRAVFVDNLGRAVINEKSLVLFIRHLLKNRPTPVVFDQKSSSVIRKAVLEMGGAPVPEKSGHAFIKRRFLELGAAVAGEVSGHFFFGELGYDDGLYAALMMAEMLCLSDKTLAELADGIVLPPITPDIRLFCPYSQQQDWLDRVEAIADTHPCKVVKLDGVRLEFEDGWALMRKSVTAEQVTLRAEAETSERLNEILDLVYSVLPERDA